MTPTKQLASSILMIRPANFGYNPQTANNNSFQTNEGGLSKREIADKAKVEFDQFVQHLRAYDIKVVVVPDTETPYNTDAVFPNNWISFHEDGVVVTYPMYAPNRRLERREEIINQISEEFDIKRLVRFEDYEKHDKFLEGTGSMILDRKNQIAYACKSLRTHPELFDAFCDTMNFEGLFFTAVDEDGQDIYHTNVMMTLGEKLAVICLESIQDPTERSAMVEKLKKTGKEIVAISYAQMNSFAGNMLEVKNKLGETFLIMSSAAYYSLDMQQTEKITQHTAILHSPLDTIEKYGGGSARCMIAEIFLPKKK